MRLTNLLVIINIVVFFIWPFLNISLNDIGFSAKNFYEGKYYTILSAMFIHGDILHLFYNMFFLFFIGNALEAKVGRLKFLTIYIFSGVVSYVPFFIRFFGYEYDTIAIGASGAISGLVGYGFIATPWLVVIIPPGYALPLFIFGFLYFFSNVLNIFAPSQIAYAAHVFGFLGGLILGILDRFKKRSKKINYYVY